MFADLPGFLTRRAVFFDRSEGRGFTPALEFLHFLPQSHPLPAEREMVLLARERPAIFPTFSEGRRWTATGILISRRGPDEGLLPGPP
jgi:hypothetical protein